MNYSVKTKLRVPQGWRPVALAIPALLGLVFTSLDATAQTTNAFDTAADAVYAGLGGPNGLNTGGQNGGYGFGAWTFSVATPNGGSGGSFIQGNGPSGNSFDLWNTGGSGQTTATRTFSGGLSPGQSFTISLRFNGLNGSDTNRFALQDAGGNILFSYWHHGGDNNDGWFSDANNTGGVATNFPYAYQSFQTFKFTLTSSTTYTFADLTTGASFTGTIANTPIAQFALIRRNGASAPGGGEDFQFDEFILTSAAPPSFNPTPAAGALSVASNATLSVTIASGGVLLNPGSVHLNLDGNAVSPTITGNSSLLGVSFTPAAPFNFNSQHTVQVSVQDNNTVAYTNTWTFSTGYGALPVTLAGPLTTGGGIDKTIFTAAGNPWLGTNYGDSSSRILYTRYSMVFHDLNGEIGGGGGYGGLQFFLGNTEKLIVGNGWMSVNWGLDAAGSQQDFPGPIPVVLEEWHTIVVRSEYVPGGNDNIKVYFDPDFSQTEGNQAGLIYTLSADASFDNVRLRCGNGTASATWTNIVLAPTAAAVGFAVAGPPTFQNLSPVNGAFSVLTNTALSAQVVIGGNPVAAASLTVDGNPVAITTNTTAGLITVNGQPSSALSAGTLHHAELVVSDSLGAKFTNDWSFTTGFISLPVTLAGPITTGGGNDLTIFSTTGDGWVGTNYGSTSARSLYARYSMVFNDLNSEIGGGGGYGGLHFMLGNAQKLIVGNGWISLNWSGDADGNQFDLNVTNSTYPVTLGEWHTIVVRTDYEPNGSDSVTIYFDPDFALTEAAQDPQNITHVAGDMSFDNVRLRCGNGTASASWTNIIVAATSAGVGFQAPATPTFQSYVPGSGAAGAPVGTAISVTVLFGSYGISSSAVSMTLDGSPVTPSFVATASSLTVNYQPPAGLAAGSTHTVVVSLTDSNGAPATTTWTFTVDAYPALPVSLAGPVIVSGGGVGTTIWSAQNGWLGGTYANTNFSGTLYTRFSMEFDNVNGETGGGGAFGGLHFYNGNTERLLIGNNWGSANWSYDAANWGIGDLGGNIILGEWHTFVIKTTYVAGGPDNVSVWLDPDLTQTESGQTNAPSGILADVSFDNIHLRAGNDSAQATYSNIVLSTTSPFAISAVPSVLSIQGNQLSWTSSGVLQQAPVVTGPWTDAGNQLNPQTLVMTNATQFYRLRQ